MAKNDNLKDFVTDIADTLRTLTQTSEPINPQDFTTKMHDIKENLDVELNEQDTLLAELQSSVDELPNQVDLSSTTATEEDVLQGKEFFNASGEKVAGTYKDMLQAIVDIGGCYYLFYNYSGNSLAAIANLDTSRATNMEYMFGGCGGVSKIPQFNTSNATSMRGMFVNCFSLTTIPPLDTSKVTDVRDMFASCRAITTIPEIDTSNCTSMGSMFNDCQKLITVPKLDTSNATSLSSMFYNCYKLTTIPELDTRKCTYFSSVFYNCYVLETIKTIDLRSTTSGTTSIFTMCKALKNLTVKNVKYALQIGSGTSWGHLLTDASIINTFQELWDLTGSTSQKLTLSTPSLARTDEIYVKLIDITDEMRAEDAYIDNKKPCVVCESTDVGAMTLKEYGISKNWTIA